MFIIANKIFLDNIKTADRLKISVSGRLFFDPDINTPVRSPHKEYH